MTPSISINFAQFGKRADQLEPSLQSFRRFFPEADFFLYTDEPLKVEGVHVVLVDPPFERTHPRYGNRANDYYKVAALLASKADVSIALDSDMMVVSTSVRRIIDFALRFGFCLPANARNLVRTDTMLGVDSDKMLDQTEGLGFAVNFSPVAFHRDNGPAREMLELFLAEMTERPVRGPLAMWRAIWQSNFNPYLLPFQWCVCLEHCGIGDEVVLHVGHHEVAESYRDAVGTFYRKLDEIGWAPF